MGFGVKKKTWKFEHEVLSLIHSKKFSSFLFFENLIFWIFSFHDVILIFFSWSGKEKGNRFFFFFWYGIFGHVGCGLGFIYFIFFGMWFVMEWWAKLLFCKASRVEVVFKCWRTHGKHCLLISKTSSMKQHLVLSLKLC